MIRTDKLELALTAKVGDKIITTEGIYIEEGIIVEYCGKYNVWFETEYETHFGDKNWHDDLKEMIRSYWKTWSEIGDRIEIELY